VSVDTNLTHWRRRTENAICWLTLDKAGSAANTLSFDVLEELDRALDALPAAGVRGLVIESGKSSGFILGADVKEFSQLRDADHAAEMARRGQRLLDRLERVGVPSVAAIDGFALGGGLELALACTYRLAVDSYERTLGLPEVQLGIHPGFGGTVRAVRLLGAPVALDLMLTGRSLSPREAYKVGLVDKLVAREALTAAAAEMIASRPRPRRAPWHLALLSRAPLRAFVAGRIANRLARRANRNHYPAPFALLDLWRRFGGRGPQALEEEARSIGRLLVTRTCRNLVRVFGLRERLRNLAPKDSAVRRLHVVGAGIMGGDIAAWCALKGLEVTVQDRAQQYVEPALRRANELFRKRLKAPGAADAAAGRLRVDLAGAEVGTADLVIEAIVEKAEAKRALFGEIEPRLRAEALVATNTSSIRLERLADAFREPARFVGLHFFNPVASLPLVEVIAGEQTSDTTLRTALSFVTRIGKLPLPCRSAPGFLVNRVLTPYMLEALHAHLDGHSLENIDAAATEFGMPVGPIELADRVGLDVALHVAEILSDVLAVEVPALLKDKVARGELGAKTRHGFYEYDKSGKRIRGPDRPRGDPALADRLILPLLNEAVACLHEGVVADADLVDAGVIFGTGFAPFTGGPLHYARERGYDAVIERLHELSSRFGTRFTPHPGWQTLSRPT
jgi:3-hydroxyacyl-CoA dehydrogenase/enoyl-CoA hydratase/3-hydroxybutyryl-CoA epimerase